MSSDFSQVDLNSPLPNDCSPKPDLAFEGLVIRAPHRVHFRMDGSIPFAIPICGCLQVHQRDNEAPNEDEIRLVVVNQQTASVFIGPIEEQERDDIDDIEVDESTRRPDVQVLKATVTSYFNPNLPDWIPISPENATYDVYLSYGRYRSNLVTIEVVEQTD